MWRSCVPDVAGEVEEGCRILESLQGPLHVCSWCLAFPPPSSPLLLPALTASPLELNERVQRGGPGGALRLRRARRRPLRCPRRPPPPPRSALIAPRRPQTLSPRVHVQVAPGLI